MDNSIGMDQLLSYRMLERILNEKYLIVHMI